MNKPVIGLALGSGAAKGWAHIGILEVFEEEGLEIEVVTGCSIGAFVGAAYVTGNLEALRDWALSLRWRDVAGMFDVSFNGGGLIEGNQILALMERIGVAGKVEDQSRRFAVVATDYMTGREVWIKNGDLHQAVRASIALPGILSPIQMDNSWYVDGGLVNPVPISTCRAMGADFIIAVNLNGDLIGRRVLPQRPKNNSSSFGTMLDRSLSAFPATWREGTLNSINQFLTPKPARPGYFDILANSINIMQDKITRSRLAGDPPHVLMNPRMADMGIFDFDEAEKAVEEGRRCARHAMPEIRYLLDNLNPRAAN